MSSKKKLSIGITINLDNYENIRLQVDGDVKDPEDASDLILYLDGVLSRIGRNDAATAQRVDSYRSRVLAKKAAYPLEVEEKAPAMEVSEVKEAPLKQEPIERIPEGDLPELLYHKPPDAACVEEGGAVCEDICELAAEVPLPEKPKEEKKAVKKEEFVCSSCGTAISKSQEQLSQLFTGKSLCKKCMDLQG